MEPILLPLRAGPRPLPRSPTAREAYHIRFFFAMLGTEGIVVGGAVRATERLSVGTREQLSTLYRLSLAEYLGTTLVLDDQLVQSDGTRMDWFRAVLAEKARAFQIIVFTCRPGDYLEASASLPKGKAVHRDTDGGIIRAINLERVVHRRYRPFVQTRLLLSLGCGDALELRWLNSIRMANQADQGVREGRRKLRKVDRLEAVSALLKWRVLRRQKRAQNGRVILRPDLIAQDAVVDGNERTRTCFASQARSNSRGLPGLVRISQFFQCLA